MTSPYDELPKNQANYAPLTPLTFIERAAYVYPDKLSVVHGAQQWTWKQTYARCRRLASALAGRGIGKNDTGAVMAPNHPLAKRTGIRLSDCIDYPLVVADESTAIRPYLDAAFTRVKLDLQPIIETNAIEIMRHAAILENGITFLTPFDIEFERRAGRLVYVPVRELAQDTQALMLIGHERGTTAIASVLAEMLKAMMREAAA